MEANTREHRLSQLLFEFGDGEPFTERDGVEGILIVGGTGSGKSTASGELVARSMLKKEHGALVLTAKADEVANWARNYFPGTGRSAREDIMVIQPGDPHPGSIWPADLLGPPHQYRCNILQHEFEQGGGLSQNVSAMLFTAMSFGEKRAGADSFWDDARQEMSEHAVELSVLGEQLSTGEPRIRLDDILDIITTAPVSFADVDSKRFRSGRCYELIRLANEGRDKLPPPRFKDLQRTARYWLNDVPGLAEETRSSIQATFTAKVSGLLRSPLRELLCGDTDEEVTPERSLSADPKTGRPKVIIVNLPVKLYREVGRVAQVLYKAGWQRAAERRTHLIDAADPLWRPAAQWADEAQYFATPEDAQFQQTARSSMIATVCVSQNLPNYHLAMGEAATQAFMGNLQTKIFHANGDPTTNEWAERVFGKDLQPFLSDPVTGKGTPSEAFSYSPVVPAIRFTELMKGGPSSDPSRHGRVGAYIFQAGRQWRTTGASRHYHEFVQDLR